jgi:protein TonB
LKFQRQLKKKIEKPRKENIQKKVVEKKEVEKPIKNQKLLTNTIKNENQKSDLPNEIKQTKVDTKEYVDKNLALIRSLINQNVKYLPRAKKVSIEGIGNSKI